MNQSFYIGATAALEQQKRMSIQGNNIANVNTYGFKAEKGRFGHLMYDQIKSADDETGKIPMGTGGRLVFSATDYNRGTPASTGRAFDFMIEGQGFFGIMDLATEEVTLTRNGAFYPAMLPGPVAMTDEDGNPADPDTMYLSDGQGNFVLGSTGKLIAVKDDESELPIAVIDYANRTGMLHEPGTEFKMSLEDVDFEAATGEIKRGMLELSNVDLAEEMTKVIESQRAYSMALKLVSTTDEIETTINGLRG